MEASACQVCGVARSRYTCPACEMLTCSVGCVKAHKQASGCDGQRKRSTFLKVSQMGEHTLRNDLSLMQDAGSFVQRKRSRREVAEEDEEARERQLRQACEARCITCLRMPRSFSRRVENRTRVRDARILWSVRLRDELRHDVDEDAPLRQLLGEHEAESCVLLMRVHGRPANAPTYYLLEASNGVSGNLRGRTLVEYPIIEAVPREQLHQYQIHREMLE